MNLRLSVAARQLAPWAMVLALQAAPGFAQGASGDGARMADCEPQDTIHFRGGTVRLENDLFTNTDQNYTNGIAFTAVSHDLIGPVKTACLPAPVRLHAELIRFLNPGFWESEQGAIAVERTLHKQGGNLIVPAFAVGRTQEVLYHLHRLTRDGRLRNLKVFVDSPMATEATRITRQHLELFDDAAKHLAGWHAVGKDLPYVHFTASAEESIALNQIRSGAIIISASGMCDAGRIAAEPSDPLGARDIATAKRQLTHARFYEEARRFAHLVSSRFQQEGRRDFVVVTGGGPGIMEAANRGAFEAGARSIGLNVTLPHEQEPNPFISPELAFRFHYFALSKMHFLLRARALVAFPGGYGTLDELFEVLRLVQTGKMVRIPIVLVGSEFWRRAVDFAYLVDEGLIGAQDVNLFTRVDTAEEIVAVLEKFYGGKPPGPTAKQP